MRVDAHVTTQFTDNVDLSQTAKADVLISPEIGVNATWAVTKLNTLRFRAAIGYAYYLDSPLLNRQTMTISPDSALSFDIYAGDVKINLHNQFSLQQDAISQGSLSGVATVERFTNTAGVSVLWDTNDVIWNVGYDHYNFITIGGANSSSGSVANTLSTAGPLHRSGLGLHRRETEHGADRRHRGHGWIFRLPRANRVQFLSDLVRSVF